MGLENSAEVIPVGAFVRGVPRERRPVREPASGSSVLDFGKDNIRLDYQFAISVDYFTGKFRFSSHDLAFDFLDRIFAYSNDCWVKTGRPFVVGCDRYETGFLAADSGSGGISFSSSDKDDFTAVYLILPGSYWRVVPDQFEILCLLRSLPGHSTRIDIALDDLGRRLSIEDLYSHCQAGNFALVDSYEFDSSGALGTGLPVPTLYLGSKSSPKRLCIYDCLPVHGFEAIRWELRLRAKYADHLLDSVRGVNSDKFFSEAAAYVLGAVDFVDRSSSDRLGRCERFPWWLDFWGAVGTAKRISLAPPECSLERSLAWLEYSVAPTLAMINKAFGEDGFQRWLSGAIATAKLSAKQLAVVQKYREVL